jgi:hypothetical protein
MRQLDIFGTNSYFNSLPIRDEKELDKLEKKARYQDEQILKLFSDHPHTSFTPVDVHLRFGQQWPITSVRRAITNLCTDEELIMTGEKRPGLYGMVNNCWQRNPEKI